MDYSAIKALSKSLGVRVTDLIALAPQNDPFYTGTPNDCALAQWFTELWQAFGYDQGVHLRRIHYQIVSQDPPVQLPNGLPYENTMECWELLNMASKAARYLGLVNASAFVDRRNAEAVIYTQQQDHEPEVVVSASLGRSSAQFPAFPDPPSYALFGYDAEQPYHLEIWCEKSTMNDILLPLCERYQANLQIGSGELSITAALSLVTRLQQAHRPARIFYVSDFDPAGQSMPVAMSRKVEYFVHMFDLDLDVRVFPVVLTLDQVQQYGLPRTPIKETERRRMGFEDRYGEGAVELDALEALYPGTLTMILQGYLEQYVDPTLSDRLWDARAEVQEELHRVQGLVLQAHAPDLEGLQAEHERLRVVFEQQMASYGKSLRDVWQAIGRDMRDQLPDIDQYPVPQPYASQEIGEGLYNTTRDYLGQIAAYKEFQGKVLLS
jgi:hypothetical protein